MKPGRYLLAVLVTVLVSSCGYLPDSLGPLADSISEQVAGQTTAWLVGGDVVVINVENSPRYGDSTAELEAVAMDIAIQSVAFVSVPLQSVSVTFFETEVTDDTERMREFFFLISAGLPVLQPLLADSASGPLTGDEIFTLFAGTDLSLSEQRKECVLQSMQRNARAAGDPQTLDPATVEFLPNETWHQLDPFGKRLILAQAISTRAFFDCARLNE